MQPRTAIVIEDDPDANAAIGLICRQAGFEVHEACTGHEGVKAVASHRPDILLLDVGLPDIDGFEVARQVREFSDTRILMLTGRTAEADTLTGFGAGIDDNVTKPFHARELRQRIEALMRRPSSTASTTAEAADEDLAWTVLEHNGLQLTEETRGAIVDGVQVQLTRMEFDLLRALIASGRAVLTFG